MTTYKELPAAGRRVRTGNLATPTLDLVRSAIESGDVAEAEDLLEYWWEENGTWLELYVAVNSAVFSWVPRQHGEERLPDLIAHIVEIAREGEDHAGQLSLHRLSPEDRLLYRTETKRSEQYQFRIWEEPDRYVMQFLPSNTAGRLMALERSTGAPVAYFGRTTKPYNWSFGRADVPYYCVHCCIKPSLVAQTDIASAAVFFEFDPMGHCKQYIAKGN